MTLWIRSAPGAPLLKLDFFRFEALVNLCLYPLLIFSCELAPDPTLDNLRLLAFFGSDVRSDFGGPFLRDGLVAPRAALNIVRSHHRLRESNYTNVIHALI